MARSPQEVTLRLAAGGGDRAALDELMPLVYWELRRLAHTYTGRESPGHTLQTSALVNEAYLRLADRTQPRLQNRAHFFAICAQLMRQILVDYAPPLAHYAEVPAELARIVRKALRKERAERYQRVGDVARELKSLKRDAYLQNNPFEFYIAGAGWYVLSIT